MNNLDKYQVIILVTPFIKKLCKLAHFTKFICF